MITESVIVDPSSNSYASTILAEIVRKRARCDPYLWDTCEKKTRTTKNTIPEQKWLLLPEIGTAASLLTANHPIDDLSYYTKVVSECSTNLLAAISVVSPLRTRRSSIHFHTTLQRYHFCFGPPMRQFRSAFGNCSSGFFTIDSMLPFVPKLSQRVWIVGRRQ